MKSSSAQSYNFRDGDVAGRVLTGTLEVLINSCDNTGVSLFKTPVQTVNYGEAEGSV